MDLVRVLLIYASENARPNLAPLQPEVKPFDPDVVAYNIGIMVEHGLLKGVRSGYLWRLGVLTWEGQDFLQAAKDETVWNQAKERAGTHFSSLGIDLVKALLKQVLRDRLGLEL